MELTSLFKSKVHLDQRFTCDKKQVLEEKKQNIFIILELETFLKHVVTAEEKIHSSKINRSDYIKLKINMWQQNAHKVKNKQ